MTYAAINPGLLRTLAKEARTSADDLRVTDVAALGATMVVAATLRSVGNRPVVGMIDGGGASIDATESLRQLLLRLTPADLGDAVAAAHAIGILEGLPGRPLLTNEAIALTKWVGIARTPYTDGPPDQPALHFYNRDARLGTWRSDVMPDPRGGYRVDHTMLT